MTLKFTDSMRRDDPSSLSLSGRVRVRRRGCTQGSASRQTLWDDLHLTAGTRGTLGLQPRLLDPEPPE